MVRKIKELSPELNMYLLRNACIFEDTDVQIMQHGPGYRRAACRAVAQRILHREATCIEKAVDRPFAGIEVGITNQIGAGVIGATTENIAVEFHRQRQT